MNQINIYIADDYYLIREGIKKSLKNLKNAFIVGESNGIEDIIPKIKETQPDILILEINLCERPLADLTREINKAHSKTKLLVISDCNCEMPIIASIKAGVSGFIRKNVSKEELVKAITEISEGKEYFNSDIAKILMKGIANENNGLHSFTDREIEILRYICKGRSNEQIGDILFLSEKTVATHKRNMMRKAAVKKTSDLILWALDNRLINK